MFATKDSFPPYMKHKHNSGKKKKKKHKHRRTTGTTKLEPQEKIY